MSASPQFAFVTLVTSDQYLPGALVVAAALRDVHPSPPISPEELEPAEFHTVCLVAPESVDVTTVKLLRRAFDVVIGVELIEEETEEGLKLLGRPDLKTVLTKLHIFRLTSYQKIVYLDADVLPLRPLSHLFLLSSDFAAVPDVGWPDIFNSGFLVLNPDATKFDEVMSIVKRKGSWDGGDQGVLNEWKGNTWERLSFTYNTTPTAAYTYAPAYKRFGSEINNIHFIGPNKPWNHIPFRPPGSSSSDSTFGFESSQDFAPPPSYAYPALLDRWFAVYDKYYRAAPALGDVAAPPAFTTAGFIDSSGDVATQRYESVWDSDMRPEVRLEMSTSSARLGLEELRRLAVEGVGEYKTTEGEGVYRSLPLDGRIDLMRPQKHESTVTETPVLAVTEKHVLATPEKHVLAATEKHVLAVTEKPVLDVTEQPTLPVVQIQSPNEPQTPIRSRSSPQMTTLPTPGPNELPPAPLFRGHSLPPETPTHSHHLGTHPHPASPLGAVSPPHPTFEHPHHPPSPSHHARPVSPPLLSWNPAVEAPPITPPPASHFPEQTYFPNVWDAPTQDRRPPEKGAAFFPLPQPSSIPEQLIKEGHYKAVIGELVQQNQEQHPPSHEQQQEEPHSDQRHDIHQEHRRSQVPLHPQPDRSKVVSVFPWEEKPRRAPQRYFPRTDSPPPGLPFIQPQSPALKINLQPLRPSPLAAPSPPVHGFPRTTTYANVWDTVPSIQRYASRLVRPAPAPTPLVPEWTAESGRLRKGGAATAGGNGYRSWQDPGEANSLDADDEDEGDDEDGGTISPGVRKESARADGLGGPLQKKTYKMKGVQTITPEMRHQGVQVQNGQDPALSGSSYFLLGLAQGAEHEQKQERVLPPLLSREPAQEVKDFERKTVASPAVDTPDFMLPRGVQQPEKVQQRSSEDQLAPSGALSPRLQDAYTFVPVTRQSEIRPVTAHVKVHTTPALSSEHLTGVEAAFAPRYTASPSSALPEGAPASQASQSPVTVPRPAGRTFDPARGVDVFKKGSEEVLARFLRMDSWNEDSARGQSSPSAA